MWSHNQWQQSFYGSGTKPAERLERYAQVFHTVEGNTTFYATPTLNTVQNWRAATHDDFRFTFKLPKAITHEQMLRGCSEQLRDFMKVMEPLHDRVGQWTIQLPAAFGPEHLDRLKKFCANFPPNFPLGVEVRHMAFFSKGEEERALNQWLVENNIDRIIMDSRPVFAAKPDNEAIIDAQMKKTTSPCSRHCYRFTPFDSLYWSSRRTAKLRVFLNHGSTSCHNGLPKVNSHMS